MKYLNLRGFSRNCQLRHDLVSSRSIKKEEALNKNNFRATLCSGFTLIELLVVVLIIGILAAVALPQYQKAVLKSRFAALKPLAKAVKHAQEIYYNEHGQYATQFSALDIQVPSEAELELSNVDGYDYVRATKSGLNNRYTVYFDHSTNMTGNTYCEALTGNTMAEELCVAEGGIVGPVKGEYTLYLLSGTGTDTPTIRSIASSVRGSCTMINMGPYSDLCMTYSLSDGSKMDVSEADLPDRVKICSDMNDCHEYYLQSNYGDRPGRSVNCRTSTSTTCDDYLDEAFPEIWDLYSQQ